MSLYRLSSDMTLGPVRFPFIAEVEINSSWEDLTDTAKITVPRNIIYKKNGVPVTNITAGAKGIWRRNDPVSISLGYNEVVRERFTGFITRIHTRTPLQFECEDSMFRLKQIIVPKFNERTINLKAMLAEILPADVKFEALDMTLGKFKIEKATITQVLDYLKRHFGLSVFFKDNVLNVGFSYPFSALPDIAAENIKQFTFQENIIDGDELEYSREDDVRLKVSAVIINSKDNTKQEVTVGDPDGDLRTLHFYNLSEAEVKKLAEEQLEKLKFEGFRGSFETFLSPQVKHGDAIKLIDNVMPDRNGVYLVKRVTTTAGMGGGRQRIYVDKKISA